MSVQVWIQKEYVLVTKDTLTGEIKKLPIPEKAQSNKLARQQFLNDFCSRLRMASEAARQEYEQRQKDQDEARHSDPHSLNEEPSPVIENVPVRTLLPEPMAVPKVGYMDGDECRRQHADFHEPCPGVLRLLPVENCSCHISAPCTAHENQVIFCPNCDYRSDNPEEV